MYEEMKVKLTGVAPLMVHSSQLADPMNQWARAIKEITSKRKKTDADLMEMARLEWFGSLYLDDKQKPILTGEGIEAALRDAGRQLKLGTTIQHAVMCENDPVIQHDGPKELDMLWDDTRFRNRKVMTVNRGKVVRTRPMFPTWSIEMRLKFDPELMNQRQLLQIIDLCGTRGMFEGRPRFGRFIRENGAKPSK